MKVKNCILLAIFLIIAFVLVSAEGKSVKRPAKKETLNGVSNYFQKYLDDLAPQLKAYQALLAKAAQVRAEIAKVNSLLGITRRTVLADKNTHGSVQTLLIKLKNRLLNELKNLQIEMRKYAGVRKTYKMYKELKRVTDLADAYVKGPCTKKPPTIPKRPKSKKPKSKKPKRRGRKNRRRRGRKNRRRRGRKNRRRGGRKNRRRGGRRRGGRRRKGRKNRRNVKKIKRRVCAKGFSATKRCNKRGNRTFCRIYCISTKKVKCRKGLVKRSVCNRLRSYKGRNHCFTYCRHKRTVRRLCKLGFKAQRVCKRKGKRTTCEFRCYKPTVPKCRGGYVVRRRCVRYNAYSRRQHCTNVCQKTSTKTSCAAGYVGYTRGKKNYCVSNGNLKCPAGTITRCSKTVKGKSYCTRSCYLPNKYCAPDYKFRRVCRGKKCTLECYQVSKVRPRPDQKIVTKCVRFKKFANRKHCIQVIRPRKTAKKTCLKGYKLNGSVCQSLKAIRCKKGYRVRNRCRVVKLLGNRKHCNHVCQRIKNSKCAKGYRTNRRCYRAGRKTRCVTRCIQKKAPRCRKRTVRRLKCSGKRCRYYCARVRRKVCRRKCFVRVQRRGRRLRRKKVCVRRKRC